MNYDSIYEAWIQEAIDLGIPENEIEGYIVKAHEPEEKELPKIRNAIAKVLGHAKKEKREKELSIEEILEKARESQFSKSCMLSGLTDDAVFYHTIFLNIDGSYTPVVVTEKREFIKVEKDKNGHFFKYGDKIYRFYSELVFNPNWDVFTTDNSVVDLIKNSKPSKKIFDEIRSIIFDCWDINEDAEYDIHSTFSILTYIQNLLGKTIYLILIGKEDTGKSTEQRCLARLVYHGTFKGKGTAPVSARLIHLLQVSLGLDEFERMSKEELAVVQGVANNGFYVDGIYWFTNMNKREISKQIQLLRAFSFKNFSLNRLGHRFDSTFLSRCHITVCVHQIRKTTDMLKPNKEVELRFQNLRNKIFIYCLLNCKKIIEDIEYVESELEKEKTFGRKKDINSIILGIYKHFKGDYSRLKNYLEDKESLKKKELSDIEDSILNFIAGKFGEQNFIEISNEDIKNSVYADLGITEESKYKPTANSIGRTLVRLKLVRKKSDKVRKGTRGNYVYRLYKDVIRDVLSRLQLRELLEKIPPEAEIQETLRGIDHSSVPSVPSDTSVITEQTEGIEQTEQQGKVEGIEESLEKTSHGYRELKEKSKRRRSKRKKKLNDPSNDIVTETKEEKKIWEKI